MTTTLTYHPIDTQPACTAHEHGPQLRTARRVECTRCGKTHVASQAVACNTLPHELGGLQAWYHLYCDHCHIIHAWWARCDSKGMPISLPISDRIVIRGNDYISKFLRKFPQAAGLEQS